MADPKKCHANARQRIDLSADVEHPALKETFFVLADKWTFLATKLEKARQQQRAPAIKTSKISRLKD
jgi:hypothetical protein